MSTERSLPEQWRHAHREAVAAEELLTRVSSSGASPLGEELLAEVRRTRERAAALLQAAIKELGSLPEGTDLRAWIVKGSK
ncbi:MAG TPA: hypothetical protein PKD73_12285 [Burkholderiaceae bacterium]|nr:hypothetical protein [Burkholderiaceae bacterium]